jgi:hypothetical protein
MVMQGIYINKDLCDFYKREKISKKYQENQEDDRNISFSLIAGMKCRNLKRYKIPDTTR